VSDELAIVACIEPGPLERQTLLLFESIRRFGGATASDASLHAFSPRGRGLPDDTRSRLDALSVTLHTEELNTTGLSYGSANRVYAGAWAEANIAANLLCVLDSDTVFLAEPVGFRLPDYVTMAARPVDSKGTCTSGPGDEFEPYWTALCELAGIPISVLGWVSTTAGGLRVRSSYNGGLTVCRPEAGVLNRAAELFTETITRGLTPRVVSREFLTGTGPVDPEASRWWGSSQAVISVAAAALGQPVVSLPAEYNVPIHLPCWLDQAPARPIQIHYHWLWDEIVEADNPAGAPLRADPSAFLWLIGAMDRLGPIGGRSDASSIPSP